MLFRSALVAAAPFASAEETAPLPLVLPKPLLVGTPAPIKVPNLEKPRSTKRPDFMAPKGVVNLAKGVEMIMPGDNTNVDIELIAPIAMEKLQKFAIREGGRTIGAGRITEITE